MKAFEGFQGKRVWVTGASAGIGASLCQQLATEGAHLILSSRREDVLREFANTLDRPDEHMIVPLDLAYPDSLQQIVQDVLDKGIKIDVLINNGGVSQRSFAVETDLEVDQRLININYLGTVAMTKAVLPSMIEQGSGVIACVSSVAGKIGSQLRSGYSGSKFAVNGFMECLRAEVWSKGVQVTVACPGWVNTDIAVNALDAKGQATGIRDKTNAEGISADECAAQILTAIRKGKPEVIIGKGLSGWAPTIHRFLPGVFRRVIRNKVHR